MGETNDTAKLQQLLRDALRASLDDDLQRRLERPRGRPVYADWWEPSDELTALDADLDIIRTAKSDFERDIAENRPNDMMEDEADRLIRMHGLPVSLRPALVHGLMESARRRWEVAELRSLGQLPVVLERGAQETNQTPAQSDVSCEQSSQRAPGACSEAAVMASQLLEPFFKRRQETDRMTHQVIGQERGTLRRFIEAAGDHPPSAYGRRDVSAFLDTLRRLPVSYGKSPKDKLRSLDELIAEADAKGAERLADKTVKRHLSTLSQFFQFAVDQGLLTVAVRSELVEDHRFRENRAAREQRDAWTSEEIVKLFSSPVWSGCRSAGRRSEPGHLVIRDARFWLPLLALFHGARLEEFADLYRRDIDCVDGTWCIRLVETEADEDDPTTKRRRLKTSNSVRVVPVHPEIIRMGLLDYVFRTAPNPADPLFPDLPPQGEDGKRGPRITRWFVQYRRAIGAYRRGVAMHAFRHTANTRLRDLVTDYGRERHVNYLLGHSQGGGQGRERYDKGPGLKAVAETLALLAYPEVDFRHLYAEPQGAPEGQWDGTSTEGSPCRSICHA